MNALGLRRDPVRLAFSEAPWSAAWYLTGYLFIGPALFAEAAVVRWCADVERGRLLPRYGDIEGGYRAPATPGVMAQLRTRWQDPATWRDIAYLLGLCVPLFALDVTVLAVWLTFLAGITLPAWYWAPWQSVHGTRFHGYQLG